MIDNIVSKYFTRDILNNSQNIKNILYFSLIMSVTALVYGSLQGGLINLSGFIFLILVLIFIYSFFQKKYKKKMNKVKNKFQQMNKPHILSQLCKSKHKNKKICKQFNLAKKNYNKINDVLLKRYEI